MNRPLTCAVNPDATREVELHIRPTARPEHVLVVGGGPVGLEVAHRLASAGHQVDLWEATDKLGGNLVVAGEADPALAPLRTWLIGASERAGVSVEIGRTATTAAIATLAPDRVVIATGARWQRPPVAGVLSVLTPDDLRSRSDAPFADLPSKLVVLGSGKVALSLAGAAAAHGHEVALVATETVLAPELGTPGRFRLVDDLERAGIAVHHPVQVDRLGTDGVVFTDGTALRADAVLAAIGRDPSTALADELRAAGRIIDVIGDATGTFGLEAGLLAAAQLAVR